MNLIKRLFKKPAKPQIVAVKTISEERLQEIFNAAPDNPLFNATLLMVDEEIIDVTNRAIDPKQPDAETKFHLGGVAALIELKEDLLERERQARQYQAEQQEQKVNRE